MDINHLSSLFSELANPASANVNAVGAEIQNFLKDPSSIFLLIQIASTNSDARLRHYSLVFARQYLNEVYSCVKEDISIDNIPDLSQLKNQLLQMVSNEPIIQLKLAICDVIELLSCILSQVHEWSELISFSFNLMNNNESSDNLLVGLYLMDAIYETISDEVQQSLFISYSTIIINALMSPVLEVRLQSINCLENFIFCISDDDDILKIPNLIENLKVAAERAVFQYSNEEECARLFGLLEIVFFDRFSHFNDFAPFFCEFAINIASNQQVPIPIRIKCFQVLDTAPNFLGEYFQENLNQYIQRTILLSYEICNQERDMTEYQFCDAFLSSLSSNVDDPNEFFSLMMQYIGNLLEGNNIAGTQVALFILASIVPNCTDAILESPETIVDLAIKGFQTSDEFILYAANDLLLALAEDVSSCLANYLDILVELLSNKISNVLFLKTLEVILSKSDRPTTHLQSLINLLLQMLNSNLDFKNEIIKCIGISVSKSGINENLYQIIAPPLKALFSQDESLIGTIFSCLGSLLQVSPMSLANDISNFIPLVLTPNSSQLSRASALLDFIEKLPISMEPFAPQALEFCKAIFSIPLEPGSSEEVEIVEARCAAIQCIAYLNPDSDFAQQAVKMLHSIYMREQNGAAISFSIAAPHLRMMKVDPSAILGALFSEFYRQEDPSIASNIINAITQISSSYSPNYIIENSNFYYSLLIETLDKKITCFSNLESRSACEHQIMPSILSLFEHFIQIVGTNFAQQLSSFQSKLINISQGNSKYLRGVAILFLADIAIVLNSPDILQITASMITINLKIKHALLRVNVFNALRILLRSGPEVIQIFSSQQQLIKNIIAPIIQSDTTETKELLESAIALWARCIISFEWQVSPSDIALVLSKVSVIYDDDNGKCVDYSELLLLYSRESWDIISEAATRIAIRSFSQDNWTFNHIPPKITEFLKSILMKNDQIINIIQVNTSFNQRIQKIIFDRLQSQ